ncbi:hypothetical protein EG329_011870 [Mollisiaceae sp. DMI_Dod_QoI]|nr:hypothetical protein EG329_011870 [Helotiales sp. DMI_Dod_QoI]
MHKTWLTRFSSIAFLLTSNVPRSVLAQSPPGFRPAISNHLTVTYGTVAINPAGITVPGADLTDAPSLGLAGTHTSDYVVIMMDFSVETGTSTGSNTTLLHWILAGLSSPNETTTLTSHEGEIAPYFPPGPPAGQTHTYGVFLYNEPAKFSVPADYIPYFNNLTASVFNRVGFNLTNFVAETGLGAPIAADWFLVSTPNTTTNSAEPIIHGYVQSASTVAHNTVDLKNALSDIATFHYVDGPSMNGSSSRPWWILDRKLEHDTRASKRWDETVKWWSDLLSKNTYDGIIGLSQGAAMTALLLSMLNHPEKKLGFQVKKQPIKFAILCSGFISSNESHSHLYSALPDVPTLHTVDENDAIVPASKTKDLQEMFSHSKILNHDEGHSIPVRGTWPKVMRDFIVQSCFL